LAEDYVLGKWVEKQLGKRVALGSRPVWNHSRGTTVRQFVARYRRWSVQQRKAVGTPTYIAELLLNPIVLSFAGAAVSPGRLALATCGAVCAAKIAIDAASARALRRRGFGLRTVLAVPAKDLLLGAAWAHGLVTSTVNWRGNQLRVLPGTRL